MLIMRRRLLRPTKPIANPSFVFCADCFLLLGLADYGLPVSSPYFLEYVAFIGVLPSSPHNIFEFRHNILKPPLMTRLPSMGQVLMK